MDKAPTSPAHETLCATLRAFCRALLAGLGAWRIETALMLLAHRRISATFSRLERMLVEYRAGKLRRGAAARGVMPGRIILNKPAIRMPRKFGWLVRAGKHHAACYGTQLQVLLDTPEMAELLEVSPQAKRLLRPVLRALAVALPWVEDVPRAKRALRVRKPRPKPEPFRIPLPRGVLAAARRQGFGRMC